MHMRSPRGLGAGLAMSLEEALELARITLSHHSTAAFYQSLPAGFSPRVYSSKVLQAWAGTMKAGAPAGSRARPSFSFLAVG